MPFKGMTTELGDISFSPTTLSSEDKNKYSDHRSQSCSPDSGLNTQPHEDQPIKSNNIQLGLNSFLMENIKGISHDESESHNSLMEENDDSELNTSSMESNMDQENKGRFSINVFTVDKIGASSTLLEKPATSKSISTYSDDSSSQNSFHSEESAKENKKLLFDGNISKNLKSMNNEELRNTFANSSFNFTRKNNENHEICKSDYLKLQKDNEDNIKIIAEQRKIIKHLYEEESEKNRQISVLESNKSNSVEIIKEAANNEEILKRLKIKYSLIKDEVLELKTLSKNNKIILEEKCAYIDQLKDKVFGLENMNQDYDNREELEILKESIGKQDIVICKLENDFKLSKQENEELKENVENKRMDVEKVTKDLSSLRKKYESSKRNLEMMEKKYSSELESKNAISKELNETKNKETLNLHQMDILNQKAKAIYDKYTLAKNNLSELNQKYVSETESKNTLVVEVNNLRNMLKENEKEIEQLTEQNKTLHAKLDASLVIRKSPTNEVGDLTNGLFNSTSNSFTFLHNYNENTTKFKESLENIKKIVDSINMFKRNFESVKAEIVSNTAAKYDKILLEKVAKLAIPLDIYKKMSKTLKDEVDSLNKEREELEHFKIGTFEYMEKLVKQHKFGNFSDGNFSTFWSSLAQHITECKSTIQKQAKIIGVLKPQERVSMKPRKLFSEDGSISPIAKEKASSQETNNDPIITEFLLSYNKAMEQIAVKKSEIIQLKYIIENNKKAISQCENDASERQMEMESKIKVLEQTLEEKHGYLAVVLKREKKAKVIVKKLAETMINHFNLHHKDMGTNCEAYQFYSIIKHATSLLQKQ